MQTKPGSMVRVLEKAELKPKRIEWEKAVPILIKDMKHNENKCHDTSDNIAPKIYEVKTTDKYTGITEIQE